MVYILIACYLGVGLVFTVGAVAVDKEGVMPVGAHGQVIVLVMVTLWPIVFVATAFKAVKDRINEDSPE